MDSECEYSYAVHIQHGIVGSRSMLRIFIKKPCSPSREQVCCLKKNLESVCKEIRDSVKSAIKASLDELHKSTKLYIGFYSTCGKNQTSSKSHIAFVKDLFQEHSGVPQHMACIDCRNEICPDKCSNDGTAVFTRHQLGKVALCQIIGYLGNGLETSHSRSPVLSLE